MIKKLTGLLLFMAGIAVIAAVILRRNDFRSMTGWDHLTLRHRIEKTIAGTPESPAQDAENTPQEAVSIEPADSLAAPAADSCVRIDPPGSIY